MDEISVRAAIEGGESSTLEFKRAAREANSICKEVAAFATSEGGILIVGVSDDRTIGGLDNPVEQRDRIERWIHEHVEPAPVIDIRIVSIDQKYVITIKVANGTAPFYSADDKPYIRIGTSSQPLKPNQIIDLVRGRPIEEMIRSFESTLSVTQANLAVTQSLAASAQGNVAPAIIGQGELATMQYNEVRDRLLTEMASAPAILALQSGVAVAQSMAAVARTPLASGIEKQGDLATMNYADLISGLMSDPKFMASLNDAHSSAISAMSQAVSANTLAQKAISEIEQLKSKLATIAS